MEEIVILIWSSLNELEFAQSSIQSVQKKVSLNDTAAPRNNKQLVYLLFHQYDLIGVFRGSRWTATRGSACPRLRAPTPRGEHHHITCTVETYFRSAWQIAAR